MARITPKLLGENKAYNETPAPMLDLGYGGQFGYSLNLKEWVNNTAYISRNLIVILLEAPRFFREMPNPDIWVRTLKALFEVHAQTIEGFNAALTVDIEEHPVGGAGEMQEEFTNVTRERSTPTFTFVEKYGLPIYTFLNHWITYGMMDPDTKYALIGTKSGVDFNVHTADVYSASALFIEPDPTHTKVMKSWVATNLFPKGTGELTGKRDLTAPGEMTTRSVEFAAISHFSIGANIFAQKILDKITITNANPFNKPSFINEIESDVDAVDNVGYTASVENTKP